MRGNKPGRMRSPGRRPAHLPDPDSRRIAGLFNGNDRAAKRIAFLLAVCFHLFLIAVTIPVAGPPAPVPAGPPPIVPVISRPPMPRPQDREPPSRPPVEEPSRSRIPVPDATPDVSEPVREPTPDARDFRIDDSAAAGLDDFMAPPEGPPSRPEFLRPGIAGVSDPIRTFNVDPVYPSLARIAGVEGRVILQVAVHPDGRVGEVTVLSGPGGRFGFEAEAVRAVRKWRYKPAIQNGRPVGVYLTVVVRFSLED